MAFETLDAISLPGDPAKANEDAFAHRADAAVVLDGATGLGEPLLPGQSDAAWVSRFGANRLMAHLSGGATASAALKAALVDCERSFVGLRRRAPEHTYEIPFASMMLAVESAGGFDAFWYGDCAAVVKRDEEPAILIGEAFEKKAREREGAARLAAARGLAPAAGINRPEFLSSLRKARNRVNTEGGGWLFGPDARAADQVQMKRVAAPAGTLVLLASDGFLALVSEYGRYDLDGLLAAAQSSGLAALGKELREIENADPDGTGFPRFKKSDDATVLLLRVA
ncbi:MAG: protein phosphatase 2C domain-containing protein [Alphaproteobacteria bacterium]|nr:protein phosphatase 2C domain-containing protein [Alphaproteobacteria bacterium]